MAEKRTLLEFISSLDRRWVFLAIGLAVALPLIYPIGFAIKVSPAVKDAFNYIDKLPKGSLILIAHDYDPSTRPEIYPMNLAVFLHCLAKEHRIVSMALWPAGASLAEEAMLESKSYFPGLRYGTDYVALGFMAGNQVVIQRIGKDIVEAFQADTHQTPLSEIPAFKGIKNLRNFDLVVDLSAGSPGIPEWVQIAGDQFGRPIIGGCTAVSAPQLYPYYKTGQLEGLLGGLKGAAEYETLLRENYSDMYPNLQTFFGTATKGMDAQSIAHLVIIIFIVIGNIAFFLERRKKK